MARAKRASDEVYNARRRLKRQAERMERDAAKMANDALRKATISYAQSLRDVAERARGKMTAEQRAETLARLATVRERTRAAAYAREARVRSNLIFSQQLNAAGVEGATSTIKPMQAKVFWVANKGLWATGENIPRNERYGRILAHWYGGETSESKAFLDWIVKQREGDLGRPLEEREREQLLAASQGDLRLVYEYTVGEKNKDLQALMDQPEIDYERVKKSVWVAH